MTPDDRKDNETEDVLGIARGPAPQTDADRGLSREPGVSGGGDQADEVDTSLVNDDTGYGVPKAPPGLHVED